jgi:hypothetical protein
MDNTTNFLIQREVRKYQSSLISWVSQVRGARTVRDAFRAARHRPNPSSLITSLRSLFLADKTRANTKVEQILKAHVDKMSDADLAAQKTYLRQCTAGEWPRLLREIETRIRAQKP